MSQQSSPLTFGYKTPWPHQYIQWDMHVKFCHKQLSNSTAMRPKHCHQWPLAILLLNYISLSALENKSPIPYHLTPFTADTQHVQLHTHTFLTVSTKHKYILIKGMHFNLCLNSYFHFLTRCLHVFSMCQSQELLLGSEALLYLWCNIYIKAIRSRWLFISWNLSECLTLTLRDKLAYRFIRDCCKSIFLLADL